MKIYDNWCRPDEGKQFILTQKGKDECASLRHYDVGKPVSDWEHIPAWAWNSEYFIESDIPGFTFGLDGFEVVYDHNGYTLSVGNPHCFPTREIAEVYFENHKWLHRDDDMYIRPKKYNGVPLSAMPIHKGKPIHDWDHYFGLDAHKVGELFTTEVAEWFRDCVPPAYSSSSLIQCGEPHSSRIDEEGKGHTTYSTFKRIAEDAWEYCGDCFRGENVMRGKEPIYV